MKLQLEKLELAFLTYLIGETSENDRKRIIEECKSGTKINTAPIRLLKTANALHPLDHTYNKLNDLVAEIADDSNNSEIKPKYKVLYKDGDGEFHVTKDYYLNETDFRHQWFYCTFVQLIKESKTVSIELEIV